MDGIRKTVGPVGLLLAGILVILGLYFGLPMLRDMRQKSGSDARETKGKITVLYDNWIGYFPLCSSKMKQEMAKLHYVFDCEDDGAAYAKRFNLLKEGKINFAVATVDTDIFHEATRNFPGVQVMVIDESAGGDAMLAWEDRVGNLNDIKGRSDIRIGYTPDSPSHHLAKAIAHHFDVPQLLKPMVKTESSKEACAKLLKKEIDVAICWEPDVSRTLLTSGIKKIIGTESTRRVIVDIFVVRREYADKNPAVVKTVLDTYFRVLKEYMANTDMLVEDYLREVKMPGGEKLTPDTVRAMMKGVSWVNLFDNAQKWYGITPPGEAASYQGLVETIDSTAKILVASGDFSRNPIPDDDPWRLTQKKFVKELVEEMTGFVVPGANAASASQLDTLATPFPPLLPEAWGRVRMVATLKVEPITFAGGAADLTSDDKEEVDIIADTVRHYPKFRILIKWHTARGAAEEESNRVLSRMRAESVMRYLGVTYNVDPNRMRALGVGSTEPIPCENNCKYVLPRVEIIFVSEVY